jgi:acetyl esterase/lipase
VRAPTIPFHKLWLLPLWRLAIRGAKTVAVPGIEVTERSDAGVRVRMYRPREGASGGALLWMHGGGLIVGALGMDDGRCSELASELRLVVVSVDYRLAPESPYPAALDDCYAAWRWIQGSGGELGVDATRVAVGGESAGGGLAACLAQRLHDEGGPQPAGQLLIYPMLDDRTAARRELDDAGHRVWDNRSNRAGWRSYLGQEPGASRVPEYAVAARREDLRGLPPAWIGVGSLDLFFEEDREYAGRLRQAGVPTTLEEVPGAPHGFFALAPDVPLSRAFVASQVGFLHPLLAPSSRPLDDAPGRPMRGASETRQAREREDTHQRLPSESGREPDHT